MNRTQTIINHLLPNTDDTNKCNVQLQQLQASHTDRIILKINFMKLVIIDFPKEILTHQYPNGCFEISLNRPKALNSLSSCISLSFFFFFFSFFFLFLFVFFFFFLICVSVLYHSLIGCNY